MRPEADSAENGGSQKWILQKGLVGANDVWGTTGLAAPWPWPCNFRGAGSKRVVLSGREELWCAA